jgi:hypothetical protein
MNAQTNAIWGQFEFDEAKGSLHNIFSSQTIRLEQEGEDFCVFEYTDGEVQTSVFVQPRGWQLFVDFRRDEMRDVVRSYGLWRRLAFFCPTVSLAGFSAEGLRLNLGVATKSI